MKTMNTNLATVTVMTDSLSRLTADIRKYPVLTLDEETELFSQYANASESEKAVIKERIVNCNLRFALSVAKKYAKDGDFVCELMSYATIGLMKAVDAFKVELGFKFISFAVHKIVAEFSEYFRTDANLVRRTNNAIVGEKDKKIAERFFKENFREPTEDEILETLETEYGIVVDKYDVVNVKTTSIDSTISSDDDACTVADSGEIAIATASVNEYEKETEQEDLSYKIKKLLNGLSVREQDIVCRKFGIGFDREYELDEIATELGYTHERCRQILNASLAKLKGRAIKVMAE